MVVKKKYWMGQTETCDICKQDLKSGNTFYDARTKMGPWALCCQECFKEYGVGVGLGVGQEYSAETNEKLEDE
jgi:hypothetical protein